MMYPLVRELAVDGVPVTVTCRVLRFSKQAFYQWKRKGLPRVQLTRWGGGFTRR